MNLRLNEYDVLTAADGDKGMELAFNSKPDLIILDIMMPGWSGLDILEELRKRSENVPVLILSAKDTTPDKIKGLGLGADDYMTKPFDLPELIARIEVMLRRQRKVEAEPPISFGDITIDRATREVRVGTRKKELSSKEFDILCMLAESPGRVFSRDDILSRVWGWDYEGTARTVDNFIARLRGKLERSNKPKYIKTVPKAGYRLELPESK
jgi:DNA-binding response OmpR family regulator